MFRQGLLYTHENMLDVCFRVLKVQYSDRRRMKIKVAWYLRRGPTPMNLLETVVIKREHMSTWKEVV